MERIVLLVILIVFGAFFVPGILRRVEIFRLSRRVRGRNLVVGLSILEGSPDTAEAVEEARKYLCSLGVRIGDLHPEAVGYLCWEQFWLDRFVETSAGKADLIVAGDWRIWKPMNGIGPTQHYLHLSMFRNNGWRIKQKKTMRLSLSKIRPSWLTHRRLTEQVLLVILRGLASTLNGPAPDLGFYYDTSEWPYSEASSSNIV